MLYPIRYLLSLTLIGILLFTPVVRAADIVAIVVEIESVAGADVRSYDYVGRGQRVNLRAGEKIVIGYLNSCLYEIIWGGSILIGEDESVVSGGTVRRSRVECDGGRLLLATHQGRESTGTAFRKSSARQYEPGLRIFSSTPFFRFSGKSRSVKIIRLDAREPEVTLKVDGRQLDSADYGLVLKPNGLYAAHTHEKVINFKVDPRAIFGGPLLSRLVPL